MIYGNLPEDIGLIDMHFDEMCFWMYCPIALAGSPNLVFPDNLKQFKPLVIAALHHEFDHHPGSQSGGYIYLTAKTLWVSGSYIGNRPGWHSDGFGTDDVNYIWCDRAPTEFYQGPLYELPEACDYAMRLMELKALGRPVATFPDRHLLRLDPSVIHRSPVGFSEGMRTFVKVSLSHQRYNLIGNAVNHRLDEQWPMVPRAAERNHPHKE